MMGVGRQYGDVVRFACEQGYKMFGVQEVLCQQTGLWNLPAPSCHSKYLDILLTSFFYRTYKESGAMLRFLEMVCRLLGKPTITIHIGHVSAFNVRRVILSEVISVFTVKLMADGLDLREHVIVR